MQKLRSPRLDTVRMVEETIKGMDEHPTKSELWNALPKKVMWSTLNTILEYFKDTNRIVMADDRIVWIEVSKKQWDALMKDTVPI